MMVYVLRSREGCDDMMLFEEGHRRVSFARGNRDRVDDETEIIIEEFIVSTLVIREGPLVRSSCRGIASSFQRMISKINTFQTLIPRRPLHTVLPIRAQVIVLCTGGLAPAAETDRSSEDSFIVGGPPPPRSTGASEDLALFVFFPSEVDQHLQP